MAYFSVEIYISDIIANNTINPGAKLSGREYLHLFLNYAKSVSEGSEDNQKKYLDDARQLINVTQPSNVSGEIDSEFELQVTKALKEAGLNVENQVGESGFKIDIGIKHNNPELGYILGIECDGATYHGTLSARLRDIWRQSILVDRGWEILRIWSVDWWTKPDLVIEGIKRKIESIYSLEKSKQDSKEHRSLELIKSYPVGVLSTGTANHNTEELKKVKHFAREDNNNVDIKKKIEFGLPKLELKYINIKHNELVNLGNCRKCGNSFVLKVHDSGAPYLSCLNCNTIDEIPLDLLKKIIDLERKCPRHGVRLVLKPSRRGYFMGCQLYPKCNYVVDIIISPEYLK